jgi:hypothetical protein
VCHQESIRELRVHYHSLLIPTAYHVMWPSFKIPYFSLLPNLCISMCVCVWLYENRNRVVLLLLSFVIRSLQRHQTFQVGVSIASKLFSLFLLSVYLFMLIQNFVFVK